MLDCARELPLTEEPEGYQLFRPSTSVRRMLEAGRSPLEIRWAVFFSAWGVPHRFSADERRFSSSIKPSFFLPHCGLWVEIRAEGEADEFEECLDDLAPLVLHSEKSAIVLFGPPKVRLPQRQGWGLRLEENELCAMPIHLIGCPGCGGFNVVGVGQWEEGQGDLTLWRRIEALSRTEALLSAYKAANDVSILLH